MSGVFVHGTGAVSTAGWGVGPLMAALKGGQPLPTQDLSRPGWSHPLRVRVVPPPAPPPPVLAHPRLRRSGVMARHAVGAAAEALGQDLQLAQSGGLRLGIVFCTMTGCVSYSRRFYEEVLADPSVASPILFPETVFNAPSSHLSAIFGCTGLNYTLVGDDGTILGGLALAAQWLEDGQADACLVVGAEETDWIVADARRLFQRDVVCGGGAGALYLKGERGAGAELKGITDSFAFTARRGRVAAEAGMRAQLAAQGEDEVLCDSEVGPTAPDTPARLVPKQVLGESFVASATWQCVAACELIRLGECGAANVAVVGANQQAIGARFTTSKP